MRSSTGRCAAAIIAALLCVAGCGAPQQISGGVGPINGGTTAATTPPPATTPTDQPRYRPYLFDSSEGNTSGVPVTLDVPSDWDGPQRSQTRQDYTSGDMLLRLDFGTPKGTAISNWQSEAQDFASTHSSYRLLNPIHSVDCPSGANDCADWEFTFTNGGPVKHVLDRAIVSPSIGFAVYVSAPEDEFPAVKAVFDHVVASITIG
jgi:hypothetical protein